MRAAAVRLSVLAVGILVGVLIAAAAGSGAEEAQTPTAKRKPAAKKPLRGRRGPRGYRGPRGFTGPMGPTGPAGEAGEAGPAGATKVLYRAAGDSAALMPFFTGQGFVLEAACNPFQAQVRSTAPGGFLVHSGMDALKAPFFATDPEFNTNDTRSLYVTSGPAKTEVQGTLVIATPTAATATVVYAIDFDTVAGACVIAGTLSPAP